MKRYQAVAVIVTNHGSSRVESGIWDSISKAQDELCYFVSGVLPVRESFKVCQTIKTYIK